ncbi:CD209 antigen-like, partial [Plectropomus leopardus]|uniref:CD209 antigen-like n=1 Tax=Plectropomus leopardus TaxID=160734 RepID=UPI001C4B0713
NLNDMEIIYDEVKTLEEKICDTTPAITENEKKAPLCTLLHLLAASLGIICVILVLVVIAVSIHFNTVKSEQHREYIMLTAQNLQLKTEKSDLERRTEELIRERDGLNWTVGVILEYENFPVKTYCSQKVCKPCLDNWVLFQSSCYLFTKSNLSFGWRTWQESRDECSKVKADLVVIDSQEEQ